LHSQDNFSSLNDHDIDFQNRNTKVIVIRESAEIGVGDGTLGPFKAGQEVDVPRWVAEELVRSGIARWRDEDRLDLATLSKIHWRETIPTARQIPAVGTDFYQKMRRLLVDLKAQSRSDPSKGRDFEKAVQLTKDIVNCRIRKIVSLAAAPAQTEDVLTNLASEEKELYRALSGIIIDWRVRMESPVMEA
jgi:hypothetical protein